MSSLNDLMFDLLILLAVCRLRDQATECYRHDAPQSFIIN